MALPKLESLIRVDDDVIVGDFDAATVTLPAGEYFWPTLITALEAAILAATTDVYTVTVDDDTDGATGRVTIATAAGNFDVTWTSTTIRDLLGFAGNLTGDDTYTGTSHAKCLWLPNCGPSNLTSPDTTSTTVYGKPVADGKTSKSPSGYTRATVYSTRYEGSLELHYVIGKKAWRAFEEVTGESFEQFWLDGIGLGRSVRYYPDRSSDASYQHWTVDNFGEFAVTFRRPEWTGAKAPNMVGPYQLSKYVGVS